MKEFKTKSEAETASLGISIGRLLQKGDVIGLNGDLGTGKTALTKGIAEALGIQSHITSPTFTIVNEYKGRIPLYHFDAYRIGEPDEMFDIGFEEYLEDSGVVVIEWSDMILDVMPQEYIRINICKDLTQGIDLRIIRVEFFGEKYKGYEEKL